MKENFFDYFRNGSKFKRKNYVGSKWDFELNLEWDVIKNSKNDFCLFFDKEEGEVIFDFELEVSEIYIKVKFIIKLFVNILLFDDNGVWKLSK